MVKLHTGEGLTKYLSVRKGVRDRGGGREWERE